MNPRKNNISNKIKNFGNLKLNLVYVIEKNTPEGLDPLEWMLLTDITIDNFAEALEKVKWYYLRWRIEIFHKILKSEFKVEFCKIKYS